jgi:hypothetical protein
MGVHLSLVNYDQRFATSKREPIIINDFPKASEEDKDKINSLIYTRYSNGSELLSNLPQCECGEIVGEHNSGLLCRNCGTHVQSPLEQDLEPLLWMRAPEGVLALINPIMWTMLNERFKKSGFEVIRWLCDTSFKTTVKTPLVIDELLIELAKREIARGYNNFVQHFDEIMELLFNLKDFRVKRGQSDPLRELITKQRDCIFSTYLPLPNKTLLVIEETNVGTYVDPLVTGAVDAINMIVSIDSQLSNFSLRAKENRTIKTIALLAEFNDGQYRQTLAKKEGIFRKHVFGTRSHFSFRAVISSLTDRHEYDELHIPWGIGVSVLQIHLANKLFRLGWWPNQIKAFLNEHAQKYHPLLDELFQQLIAESPYKGIPVVFQRNPSLERGSAQAMFVTKVKTDVDVPTVSLSILSVVGYNADFDGDQLNGTLSIDIMTTEELKNLAPHKSVFDLNAPRMVSRNLSMPKPVVATISSWIGTHHAEDRDPAKEARMAKLPNA